MSRDEAMAKLGAAVDSMLRAKPIPRKEIPAPTAADLRRRFKMINGHVREVDEDGKVIDEQRIFNRVTPAAEFPAAVATAIREGRARAQERGYTPVLVCLTPGATGPLDEVADGKRREGHFESMALDPDTAEAEFVEEAAFLRSGAAVLVRIIGESSPQYAAELLEILRRHGPVVGKFLPFLGERVRLGGGLGKMFARDEYGNA